MAIFRVHQPGPYSTIQDRGRFDFQHMGVPVSGALDPFAHAVANDLVGNDADCATLEITFFGPELEVLENADIAVTGAAMALTINGVQAPQWETLRVQPGDRVDFGQAASGCRAYLAVTGGFDVPVVMGSRATFVSGAIGGVAGRQLQSGDILSRGPGPLLDTPRRLPWQPIYGTEIHLRAVPGPQDDSFPTALGTFFSEFFTVTGKSNRMGYRLQGPVLERDPAAPKSIISEPSVHGNVQVPPDGQPIVLMVEQTIGGYTKIATVVTADLFKIAQARPGDRVRFHRVDLDEAHSLYRQWLDYLRLAREAVVPGGQGQGERM
ncbi:MAG: biotin-dependent carboxyltransferase [Desulfatitalea sp.]|nr:biotin-dependent carboxyltransferase [Desulfatitalea sp.]